MSAAAYAAVREKPLSPAHEKKHTPAWVSPETAELLSAAFDVVIASRNHLQCRLIREA